MTRRLVTDSSLRRRPRVRMRSVRRLAARQQRELPGAVMERLLRAIRVMGPS